MASAFTINFTYNGSTYMAVISKKDNAINIFIPDETLHSLIPGGKFSFNPRKDNFDSPQPEQVHDLIVNILGVIQEKQ